MGDCMLRQLLRTLAERETWILIYATALLCFLSYHPSFGLLPSDCRPLEAWATKGLLLLGTPLLFSLLVLRENPLRFGLGAGDARSWARWLLLFIAVMAAAILAASKIDRSFAAYYPTYWPARWSHGEFLLHAVLYAFYLFGWEYFLRGFLVFSLEKRFGSFAAVLQMVPFVFSHVGKPELETYSSIAGGLILGVLALRTRSMWPCFLIHAFVAIWMDVCVVYICR